MNFIDLIFALVYTVLLVQLFVLAALQGAL